MARHRVRAGGHREQNRGRDFHPQNRRGHRARRRGREDHLLRKRHRAAHERHLCRRYRRIHRPDGGTFEHRCGRPERACAECDHHLSHRLALRRVREDRRAAAFERGRAQGGHRRVHLPVRRDADHLRPCMRPAHPRLRGVFGRSAAIPSRTAQTLLRDARARRGAPHRARQRAPVRGKRLRHRGRGERDRARREALRRARSPEESGRHPGLRGRAPASAVRKRRRARRVQGAPCGRVREARESHGLHGRCLPGHRRGLDHVQGDAHRRGGQPPLVALRVEQGRRARVREGRHRQALQRDAGRCQDGRTAHHHRACHGHRLRRSAAP